jgi:hypothetical protein
MVDTVKLDSALMVEAQSRADVIYNTFAKRADAFIGVPKILLWQENTPPGSVVDGDMYLLGGAPTGVWSGQLNKIALYDNGWVFFSPFDMIVEDVENNNTLKHYSTSVGGWSDLTVASGRGTTVFNVKDEGAVGGDAAKDGLGIQAAIDKAEVAGGVVLMPYVSAKYLTNQVLTIEASNVSLIGEANVTIKANSPTFPGGSSLLTVGGAAIFPSGVELSGFRLEGSSDANVCLHIHNMSVSRVRDIDISEARNYGLFCESDNVSGFNGQNTYNHFDNLYIHDNDDVGALFEVRESTVNNIRSYQNGGHGIMISPFFWDGQHQVASVHSNYSNLISQLNTGDGLVLDCAQRMNITNVVIENCGGYGIRLTTSNPTASTDTPTGTNDVRLTGVVVRYCDDGGIFQDTNSWVSNLKLDNFNLWGDALQAGSSTQSTDATGLWLKGARNVCATNFQISGFVGSGIRLTEGQQGPIPLSGTAEQCAYLTFSCGQVVDNGYTPKTSAGGAHGIHIEDSPFMVTFDSILFRNLDTNSTDDNWEVYIDGSPTDIRFNLCDTTWNSSGNRHVNIVNETSVDEVIFTNHKWSQGTLMTMEELETDSTGKILLPAIQHNGCYLIANTGPGGATINGLTSAANGTIITLIMADNVTYSINHNNTSVAVGERIQHPTLGGTYSAGYREPIRLTYFGGLWMSDK